MNAWVSVQAAKQAFRGFVDGWHEIPLQRRQAWLWTLTGAWAALGILMISLALLGERFLDGREAELDEALLRWLIEARPLSFDTAVYLESPGNAVVLIPLVVVAAIVASSKRQPLVALSILASFFMLAAVVVLGWVVWDRPRPDAFHGGIASPAYSAFPSGHVAQSTAAYGFLTYLWLRAASHHLERIIGVVLLILAVMIIAIARLYLGTHWPSDALAGVLVGGAWLAMLILAIRRAER